MLATVYWLRRELLRRGQEALVVRLNFVFFTDSVAELYGQRMYLGLHVYLYWILNINKNELRFSIHRINSIYMNNNYPYSTNT
jgi:hypothetical protein